MTRHTARPASHARCHGYTLVELLTSLVMGMIILAAGFALYTMSRGNQNAIANSSTLDERGWLALDAVASQLRQAGYVPPGAKRDAAMPMLLGLDDCDAPAVAHGTLQCTGASAKTDALLIRFYGASRAGSPAADDTVIDCAGEGVPAPDGDSPRGASLFFVRHAADGTASLICRHGVGASAADVELIRGVERMELLYGISTAGDGMPDKVVPARVMTADDWRNVATVTVSLLLRGDHRRRGTTSGTTSTTTSTTTLAMFGAADDPDYRVETGKTPDIVRRVFTSTVQLRNRLACPTSGDPSCG